LIAAVGDKLGGGNLDMAHIRVRLSADAADERPAG